MDKPTSLRQRKPAYKSMAPKSKTGTKSPSAAASGAGAASSPPPPVDPVVDILASQPVPDIPSAALTKPRKLAYPVPDHISPETINNTESLLRFVILGLISAAAIGSRLFAVIRFESVIHEL